MREGDYFNAIQYAKLAISYCPEDSRFYFLLGECQVKNPAARWQRMAEQNYVEAARLDQWNAEYRVSLGRFYARRGTTPRSRDVESGVDGGRHPALADRHTDHSRIHIFRG